MASERKITEASSKHPGCLDKALISCVLLPNDIRLSDHAAGCMLKPCAKRVQNNSSKAVLQMCSSTYHNGEDDGQEGGF